MIKNSSHFTFSYSLLPSLHSPHSRVAFLHRNRYIESRNGVKWDDITYDNDDNVDAMRQKSWKSSSFIFFGAAGREIDWKIPVELLTICLSRERVHFCVYLYGVLTSENCHRHAYFNGKKKRVGGEIIFDTMSLPFTTHHGEKFFFFNIFSLLHWV